MRNILKRIYIGLYEGYKIQIVPSFILNLEQKLYFKLFKLIGGIATAFIITGIASNYSQIVFYSAVLFSLPYLLYRIIFVYFVTVELCKIIKQKRYQVHNSPVDHLTTIFKGVFIAVRTTAKYSVAAGMAYSLAHELDNILDVEGRERVFVPAIKKSLDQLGVTESILSVMDKLGITKTSSTVDSKVFSVVANELGLTESELLEGVKIAKERKSLSNNENSIILKNIEKKD